MCEKGWIVEFIAEDKEDIHGYKPDYVIMNMFFLRSQEIHDVRVDSEIEAKCYIFKKIDGNKAVICIIKSETNLKIEKDLLEFINDVENWGIPNKHKLMGGNLEETKKFELMVLDQNYNKLKCYKNVFINKGN